MAENGRRRSFLIGLVSGAVVGSVVTAWLIGRIGWWGRRRGAERGGKAGEIVSVIMERGSEFLEKVREAVGQAIEGGRETARKTRSELDERFRVDREE